MNALKLSQLANLQEMYFVREPLFRSHWLPFSSLKAWILRRFGAEVGQQVRLINPAIVKVAFS